MRLLLASLTLLLAAAPVAAQHHHPAPRNDDPDNVVQPAGALPAGWRARTDRGQPTDQLSFTASGRGYHAVMGPAAVLYNAADTRRGDYRVAYTFTQNKAPAHPESYGIFIGGRDLDGAQQAYSYFLIRGTGEYFLATRNGAERTVIQEWTTHPAIQKQDAGGRQVNVVSAEARGDEVIFSVNGTEIARRPKVEILSDGITGLRINHNLDVQVDPVVETS